MSALEELWLWLQGRSSQTEAGTDTMDAVNGNPLKEEASLDSAKPAANAGIEARVQRHARYRAGPWQMK